MASNDKLTEKEKLSLNESLIEAIKRENLSDIKSCLDKGADVNFIDKMNMSILEHARLKSETKKEETIREIINRGANVNNKTRCGQTEFMFLVHDGDLTYEYISEILDTVENINERNILTGGTFLHLLTARSNDKGRHVLIKKLLSTGLCVNATDNNGSTPLHTIAGFTACRDSMEILISHGADIQAVDRQGENALHYLASANELEGFSDSLKLLLQVGVDINSVDEKGQSALHHAVQSQDAIKQGINELLKHGIKTNVKDKQGRNEIYHAVESLTKFYFTDEQGDEREEIIKILYDVGVDVNEGDANGVTPLHIAVSTTWSNMLCIIGCLLYNVGADPIARTKSGTTPLHWACKSFNQTLVILLWYLKNGLDINITDNFGSSALHWAVWFREMSVARLLLQRGIDASCKDKAGETASHLAKKVHLDNFVELLENYSTSLYKDLDENLQECSEADPLFACKQLRFIRKENGSLAHVEYIDHVKQHQREFKSSIDAVLHTTNMGLYYEIEENATIASLMRRLLLMVQENISKQNPLFCTSIQLARSNFEGTKVNLPDEFDYNWKLNEFSEAFEPVESINFPGGYIKLKLTKDDQTKKFARYINESGLLDCKLMLTDFYTMLNTEVDKILRDHDDLFGSFICLKHLNEISCNIDHFLFRFQGRQAKFLQMSVDIVPTIELQNWKPSGFNNADHLLLRTLDDKWNFSAVFKTPDRLIVKDFSNYFRLSYASIEQAILSQVPHSMKMGYILLKSLFATQYCPRCVDHDNKKRLTEYITSYQIKTAFLFELEAVIGLLDNKFETNDEMLPIFKTRQKALEWAYIIIAHLEQRIQSLRMPSYFNPNTNILGWPVFPEGMVDPIPHAQQAALLRKLLNIYEQASDEMIYER